MKRVFISLLPAVTGFLLAVMFRGSSDERVRVIALQFIMLTAFAVITVSWISKFVKTGFIKMVFMVLGFLSAFSGVYILWKTGDGMLSLPFFVITSWLLFRAS